MNEIQDYALTAAPIEVLGSFLSGKSKGFLTIEINRFALNF
jgi:hypothetical protein